MEEMRAPRRFLPSASVLLWVAPALAQGPTWTSPDVLPAARYDHAMAFDEGRGRAVLFGGRDLANLPFGDTWEWNGSGWTLRAPAHNPSARFGSAMAYDPIRGVTVLFGGNNGAVDQADTWEWDGVDWAQRAPASVPPARAGHAMTYHGGVNPGVLMHGGFGNFSTWQWNGSNWTLRQAAGPASAGCGMAYVGTLQRSVLLATVTSATSPVPGFAWDGSSWTTLAGNFPAETRVVYDPDRDVLLAFGGRIFNGLFVGGNISVQTGSFGVPNAVLWNAGAQYPTGFIGSFTGMTSVYDTARRTVLTFGGTTTGFPAAGVTNALAETPSATGVTAVRSPSVTANPGPRLYGDMEFDELSGQIIAFAGYDGLQLRSDSWTFDGRNWTNHGSGSMAPRIQPALCSNPAWGTVMFGGGDFGSTFYNDTLLWAGSTFLPSLMAGSPPPARRDHDMVFDRAHNRIVMFGGYNGSYLADAWQLTLVPGGFQWNPIGTIGSPGPRNGHRLAYDERRDRVVLFGGSNQGIFDGTTWELTPANLFSPAVWTQINTTQSPPPRWAHTMGYDVARGVVVVGGGYGNPLCGNFCATWLDDVWEYDGVNWKQRALDTRPLGREGAGFCYDRAHRRFVMQGGAQGGTYPSETWFLDAPVDRFAQGMVGGSPVSLRCLRFPVAGQPVRFELRSQIGFGWITIYAGPAPAPGLTLGPGLLCGTGSFYGVPAVLGDAMGTPGILQFHLPASLAGLGFVAQGIGLDPTLCVSLSDPLAATITSQ